MLLQNLAGAGIIKTIYDLVVLPLLYFERNTLILKRVYFFIAEMNFMTIVHYSFIAVNMDRHSCVLLKGKYALCIKYMTNQKVVCGIWLCVIVPVILMTWLSEGFRVRPASVVVIAVVAVQVSWGIQETGSPSWLSDSLWCSSCATWFWISWLCACSLKISTMLLLLCGTQDILWIRSQFKRCCNIYA